MQRPIQCILAIGLLLTAGSAGLARPTAAGTETDRLSVRILVFNDAGIPDVVLSEARQIAERVYLDAGIETAWQFCSGAGGQADVDCSGPFGLLDLFLRIRPTRNRILAGQGHEFGLSLLSPDERLSRQAYVFFDSGKGVAVHLWTSGRPCAGRSEDSRGVGCGDGSRGWAFALGFRLTFTKGTHAAKIGEVGFRVGLLG